MTIKLHTVPLILAIGLLPSQAHAQVLNASNVSREIEKTLPSIEERKTQHTEKRAAPTKEKKRSLTEGFSRNLPDDQALAYPVEKMEVDTPVLRDDIEALLRNSLINLKTIKKEELARIRQEIWDLGIKNKKLLYTKFRVIPGTKNDKASAIAVDVSQIAVQNVRIVSEAPVRQPVLDALQREAEKQFAQNKVLDLEELDNALKHRLRLGDVSLRMSVVPVDETHVDLELFASPVPKEEPEFLAQYDNAGGWSFGRDRLISGASLKSALMPGDTVDLMGMKSADIGNTDFNDGTYFGRLEYATPVGEWGLRFNTRMSGMHYHEVRNVSNNRASNGEALELGQGVMHPLYTDRQTIIDLRVEFLAKYSIDRALETSILDKKTEYAGRIKASLSHSVSEEQMVQATLSAMQGVLDLTGHSADFAQDQAGPKQNGLFTKIEPSLSWVGSLGEQKKADFRIDLKSQWAPKNLDSAEQFSLGGMTGMRAFGSGEGSGDIGWMANGNLGYKVSQGVRIYALYDIGEIRKSARVWRTEGSPYSYVLQDAGAGISKTIGPVDLGLIFAHQIGPNPGETTQGLDIDNSRQHYRVWSSIAVHF